MNSPSLSVDPDSFPVPILVTGLSISRTLATEGSADVAVFAFSGLYVHPVGLNPITEHDGEHRSRVCLATIHTSISKVMQETVLNCE